MAYEDLFDPADDKKAKAGLNLRYGIEAAPDVAARDASLAKRYGLPAGVIEQYRPDYDARAKVEDAGQLLDQSPKLRDWLAADPVRAKVSHDDIGNLSAIESAVRYLVSAPDAPRGGLLSDVGKAGRSLAAAGPGAGAGAYGAAAAPFEVVGLDGIGGWLRQQQKDAQGVSEWVAGVSPDAGFLERSVLSGFQSAGQTLLTLPLGFAAKGEALMLGVMGLVTGGQSYGKGRDAGLDPAQAAAFGIQNATAEIVTEKFLGAAGFLKQIKAGDSAGKLFGYQVLKETPGEIGATLWQNFNEWGNVNPDKSVADFLAEQPEAIVQTVIATIVGGSVQIGAVKGAEKVMGRFDDGSAQATQAQMAGQQLDTIAALAEASKLKARSPETFAEFANELAQSSVPAIFIDAQALMQSGVNIQEVAQAMPSVAAQLQQAVATGGDIEIPTAEFVQGVPGSTFQQQLIDHARAGANAMSRAEADVFMKEKGDAIKAEIEAEAAKHEQDADWQMQRNEVRDGFEQQLNAAGRFQPAVNKSYAAVLGDFYAVTASRAGMTPKELVQRYPLRIQATAPGGAANSMEQGDTQTPEFKAWFGESKVVDADGAPLVLYHGTGGDFSEFNVSERGEFGGGIYMTPDAKGASDYATYRGSGPANVMPLYVSIKNPATAQEAAQVASWKGEENARQVLIERGYDGVIDLRSGQVVAFFPEQIKSATGNTGAFDPANPSILNQSAYHGTPHRGISQFSTGKIGTGEGFQAFGWGLYFTNKKDIAEFYREKLTKEDATQPPRRFFKGVELQPGTGEYHAARLMDNSTLAAARKDVASWIKDATTWSDKRKADKSEQDMLASWKRTLEVLNEATGKKDFTKKDAQGQTYEVELPEDDEMLTWDKPLGKQSDTVKAALKSVGLDKDLKENLSDFGSPMDTRGKLNGENIYAYLKWKLGSDKAASDRLRELGIKGTNYPAGTIGGNTKSNARNYVIFSGDDVAIKNTFYQGEQARAQISFGPSIADSGAIISLLENADLSSFVHEVGHLFLEIQADLAARVQANIDAGENVTEGERQIVADMGKLTDWFGAQDHARAMKDIEASVDAAIEAAKRSAEKAAQTGDAKDAAQAVKDKAQADRMLAALNWLNSKGREGYLAEASRNWFAEVPTEHRLILATPYHETFARGWERYAFEGNSPNLELQTIFQRFAAWMKSIYRTLTSLNVNLTDEVRGVMDRMIATEEQIKEAETARAMGPLFTEQGGMTPEQWAAYQAQGAKATQTAVDALQSRALADMKWLSNARAAKLRELQKQADALRRDIRREVTREVMSLPVYRAWTFLTGKGEADQKAQAEPRVKGSSGALDPATDNIFQAIAKLGGLRRDEVQSQWGLDSKAETISSGVFGRPVVRKEGGLSIDMMTEALVAEGYLMADENGRGDPRDLEEAFDSQRMGVDQFSVAHDYAAQVAAANGEAPAEPLPDYVTHGKLNTTVLREMYGTQAEAIWRKLSDRRMTSESGIQPDVLAETMGYPSGDAMVRELADARPPRDLIRDLTDQRMLQEHGELSTAEGLDKATTEALANKVRTRFLATELQALDDATKADSKDKTGKTRSTASALDKAAEVYAARTIGAMKIEDIKPHKFEAAATRAAKLAAKAFKAGKTAEAAMHKRSELIQLHAAKAAHEALAEAQKARDHFGDIARRSLDKLGKTYDIDVVQAIRAVLAEYGVGTRGEQAAQYLAAVERNDPDMHKVLKAQIDGLTADAKPIDTLTVDSLRALVDEVGAMWHLARRSKQMEVDGNLIDRQDVEIELLTRLEEIGIPDTMPGDGKAVTDSERRISRLREAMGALMRVENWAIRKDGSDNGAFTRFVFRPIKAASDAYRAERGQVLRKYRDLLAGVNLGVGRISAPELGYEFGFSKGGSGKAELMHAILHTGNDSNKRKLLLGRKWADVMQDGETVDTGRWERFIERMIREGVLTKADFDFAQGVWDLLETLKPAAQKTHRDVFGRYFDEITANPVTNSLGTWAGGYVPAMADSEIVKEKKTRELAEAENNNLSFAFPSTGRGFTKARVEYNRPLLLDLRSLAGHIDKVLLFTHLEQPVRDVRRVLTADSVADPLHKVDPAAFDSVLTPWLMRAARQQVETPIPGDGGGMRVLSRLRARAGMAAMMANISNTAQQITGFSIAAVKVPPRHLMSAAHRWITSPRKTSEAVSEASVYMRNRMDNETAMMTQEIQAILLNPSLYEKAQDWTARHAYFMQSAVDNVMGPIIWTGAYNNALEQGKDENDARAIADGVVRQTQGSTLAEDVSRIETGNAWWRMFSQFAGYFNMQANLLGTEFANSMHDVGLRKGMGKGLMIFTLGFAVPALLSELIVQAFRGGPDDEDKDGTTLDDWFAALGIGQVRSAVAMVPVVGQLGGYALNLSNDKPYDDRISTAPAVSMLESAVRAPFSVYEAAVNDKSSQKAVRDVATLMSITTGLPFNAIARPVGYVAGMADDRIDPTSPADAARGLLTGVASPASKP